MIDIQKARNSFKSFLEKYNDKNQLGFELKVVHIYHVVENAKNIAIKFIRGRYKFSRVNSIIA